MAFIFDSAPDFATHWDPVDRNWLRQIGLTSLVWDKNTGWSSHEGQYPNDLSCMGRLYERPASAEWNGEGLPPVGIFCEYERLACKFWIRCEVLAHRNNAAVVIDDSYDCELVESRRLRPIRTAEQIAADQKQQEIEELMIVLGEVNSADYKVIAKSIQNAGYRKQASE